tara:strand:- start:552 stop:1352 length:801 start_codon:yes stop_codon:yes gene_type:complete
MNINFITRQLIRSSSKGYLSTHFDPKNFTNKKSLMNVPFPYSTFTLTAFDYDLSPILLFSDLSEHTTNILKNKTVSLMVCEETKLYQYFPKFDNNLPEINYEDPMSRPRVTIIGEIRKSNDENLKRRFLMRHPASKLYVNFSDMNFYKIKIKSAHLIGGFASVKWFGKKDLCSDSFINFKNLENDIINHMNQHHQDSVNMYVNKLIANFSDKKKIKGNWGIVGIDPDGFDVRKKNLLTRFFFKKEINDAKKLRGIFVKLHRDASKI